MIPRPYVITEAVRRFSIHFAALDRAPVIIDYEDSVKRARAYQRALRVVELQRIYDASLVFTSWDRLFLTMREDDPFLWLELPSPLYERALYLMRRADES